MKKLALLAFSTISLVAMESKKDNSSTNIERDLLTIQQETLSLKKEELAIRKREEQIARISLLLNHANSSSLYANGGEQQLFYSACLQVSLDDLFFDHLREMSVEQRERISEIVKTTKKALAAQRSVPVENVFNKDA